MESRTGKAHTMANSMAAISIISTKFCQPCARISSSNVSSDLKASALTKMAKKNPGFVCLPSKAISFMHANLNIGRKPLSNLAAALSKITRQYMHSSKEKACAIVM